MREYSGVGNRNRRFVLPPWALSVFILPVLIIGTAGRSGAAPGEGPLNYYYVDDGKGVHLVKDEDPARVKPDEWQVRLYRAGAATGGRDHWGLITGKTAESVMKQLKDAQDFELRYNHWAGKGYVHDDVLTNFNPLGPIAVMRRTGSTNEEPKTGSSEVWKNLEQAGSRANDLRKAYNQIRQILATEPKAENPFRNVGSVLKDYAKSLSGVFDRVTKLRNTLNGATQPPLADLQRELAELNRELELAGTQYQQLQPLITQFSPPESPTAKDPAKPVGDAANDELSKKIEALTTQITEALGSLDPANPDATFNRINGLARQMLSLMANDPSADADTKKLAQVLLEISDSKNEAAFDAKLQQLTDLIEKLTKN